MTEQNNLSERVAVVENDIEHLQDNINNVGNVMRQTAKAHDEKLDRVLGIVEKTSAELNRYKIISGTALALIGGLMTGANYLMGVFGVSLSDLWSKIK